MFTSQRARRKRCGRCKRRVPSLKKRLYKLHSFRCTASSESSQVNHSLLHIFVESAVAAQASASTLSTETPRQRVMVGPLVSFTNSPSATDDAVQAVNLNMLLNGEWQCKMLGVANASLTNCMCNVHDSCYLPAKAELSTRVRGILDFRSFALALALQANLCARRLSSPVFT